MLRLRYLPANGAWCVAFGDGAPETLSIVTLATGRRLFASRAEAIADLRSLELAVGDDATTICVADAQEGRS